MTIDNKSEFIDEQEDVCEIVSRKPEEEEKDRICPTCVPDQNFVPPQWWTLDRPFLNKKTCEYSVGVSINQFGDSYTPSTLNDSELLFDVLKKTYIRPAIRIMLRYYDKLETDDIVCAAPPQSPGEECGNLFDKDYRKYVKEKEIIVKQGEEMSTYTEIEIDNSIKSVLGKSTNLDALELYARTPEFKFSSLSDDGILSVLVTIPAFIFDKVPDAPELPEVDTQVEKLSMRADDFELAMVETTAALRVFSSYQAYFYQTENGNLFEEETQNPFYIKFLANRMNDFLKTLSGLIDLNGFRLSEFSSTKPKVDTIEIFFDKSDPLMPFKVKKIRIKQRNCNFVRLKKGFKSWQKRFGDLTSQTVLGYVAQIDKIHPRVTARKTPPWLDFILEFTYPQLAIDYGSSLKFSDQRPDSCLSDLNSINNAILGEVLTFSKAFEYQLNKANCKSLYGNEYIFDTTPGDFDPNKYNIDEAFSIPDAGFDVEHFKKSTFLGKRVYLNLYARDKVKVAGEFIREKSPIMAALENFKKSFERGDGETRTDSLQQLVRAFNPCSFKDFTKTLLKCLFRGMTVSTAYKTVIKKTLGSITSEALEVVIQALPADKQEEIRKQVQRDFENMPAPWEDNWKSGSLSNVRNKHDRNRIENTVNNRDLSFDKTQDLKQKIQKSFEILKYNGFSIEQLAISFVIFSEDDSVAGKDWSIEFDPSDSKGWKIIDVNLLENKPSKVNLLRVKIESTDQSTSQPLDQIITDLTYGNTERTNSLLFEKDYDRMTESVKQAQTEYQEKQLQIKNDINTKELLSEKLEDDLLVAQDKVGQSEAKKIQRRLDKTYTEINKLDKQMAKLKSNQGPSAIEKIRKNIKKQSIREIVRQLTLIQSLEGKATDITKSLKESTQHSNWNSLTREQKDNVIQKETDKAAFARLNPEDQYEEGTLGAALGNTQQAITKAYVEAIMEKAEIQEIMAALDNIPGIDLIGRFVGTFKCPKTHYIFPPIDSFLKTLTFDPCGDEPLDLTLPAIGDIPNFSGFSLIKNLVKTFITALKVTLREAFMALMAKLAQLIDASICRLVGGENPLQIGNLLESMGREDCQESEILKAALNAPPGRKPLKNEDYANLARTISNAGPLIQQKRALVGDGEQNYFKNVKDAIAINSPEFSDVLSSPDAIAEFFQMAGSLVTPEQQSSLQNELNSDPVLENPTSKCITDEDKEAADQSLLDILPPEVGQQYLDQEDQDNESNAEQVIDIALSGPEGVIQDILDQALSKDPDCQDNLNSDNVGQIMKKARETESFKLVKGGIFKRIQKAFLDDVIDWNLLEFFDSPGILGSILADTRGRTLNYYNFYRNSPGFIKFFLPDAGDLPETVGLHMREYYLENDLMWKGGQSTDSLVVKYANGDIEDKNTFRSEIKLQNNHNLESLKYRLSIQTPEFDDFGLTIEEEVTDQNIQTINDLQPFYDDTSNSSYRVKLLRAMIKSAWKDFPNPNIKESEVQDILDGLNSILHEKFMKKLLSDKNGQLPQGFLYGYDPVEITADDLTYVNPEDGSTEYTYSEEEQVLGRSLTNNPRVNFLDPVEHGGSYRSPFYYILSEEKSGWSMLSKNIVSTIQGCEEVDSNFLFLQDIMDNIEKEESSIKADERLQLSPECVIEKPFDKIANPSTLAIIGGVVTTTIRMYTIDYLLRTFAINSNVDLSVERNYGKSISKLIAHRMREGLIEQRSLWTSTYEGYVYWLLFLEQAVQTLKRKIDSGEVSPNSKIRSLLNTLNEAQKSHKTPTYNDLELIKGVKELDFTSDDAKAALLTSLGTGALLAAGGAGLVASSIAAGTVGVAFGAFKLSQARLSAKLSTIYSVEDECIELLSYLIDDQLEFYSDVMSEIIFPKPNVYDISKYFIGDSKVSLKQTTKAGIADVEIPVGGKSNIDYGSVDDCVKSIFDSAINEGELSQEDLEYLGKNGGFYIEKYLRIVEKPNTISDISDRLSPIKINRQFVNNRDQELKNVVNVEKFKEFLKQSENLIHSDANISDYFGDAKINLLEDGYQGSVGIKFGVRLCLTPPKSFEPFTPPVADKFQDIASREKSFILANNQSSNRYSFPVCSFEQDVKDNKLKSYVDSDENFNQDIKCYIDGLTQTGEFRLLFDHILNIKKVPSMMALYSYLNFYASLGLGANEREDEDVEQTDLSNLFNDTRHELRKMFVSNYKRVDFDPPNEEDQGEDLVERETKKLLAKTLNNSFLGGVPFWLKFRKKEKKLDKNNEPCKNQFGGLVNISGDST